MSNVLINTYCLPALFVGGGVLYSNEGTTQGDPLAMPFYALATIPLLQRLLKSVIHTWYMDDASACADLLLWSLSWGLSLAIFPMLGNLACCEGTVFRPYLFGVFRY